MNSDKIALITGANKGIGFETSGQLGKLGYTIILGSRDEKLGQAAVAALKNEDINVQFVVLDVTDETTIKNAFTFIKKEFGHLDVLVNNAGIFLEKGITPGQLDMKALRNTFDVNFFGVFAMTTAMLPLLKRSAAGRIVNVSSGQGSLTRSSNLGSGRLQLAYNSSKAALNMLTVQFAKELMETPVKINSAAPGFTITDMNEGQGNRTVQEAAKIIVYLATLDGNGKSGGFFEDAGEIPW